MDETMMNTVNEEIMDEENVTPQTNDELKTAIQEQLSKIRRQSILVGAQTACTVILEKITVALREPGKRTMNDYRRLIKDIQQFCETGISRQLDESGEPKPIGAVETVQN